MKRALVIGINRYNHLRSLSGCEADAEAVKALLRTNADDSPNFYVKPDVAISGRKDLTEHIRKLFAEDGETNLLYFAGHGHINEQGGYIMAPDSTRYDEGMPMDEILSLANNSNALNNIIILDCCHAGNMGVPTAMNRGNNKGSFLCGGVTILTACREHESAIEKNGHGIFTALLLEALEGGAADLNGEVTPGSIYSYIDKSMGAWGQRPVFKTNVSYFTSLRRASPPISLNILRKITTHFTSPDFEYPLDPSFEFTNTPAHLPTLKAPEAIPQNTAIFKELQMMERVGLVAPEGEMHMYFAAMNSKSCKLTPLGQQYWRTIKKM